MKKTNGKNQAPANDKAPVVLASSTAADVWSMAEEEGGRFIGDEIVAVFEEHKKATTLDLIGAAIGVDASNKASRAALNALVAKVVRNEKRNGNELPKLTPVGRGRKAYVPRRR